MATELLRIRYSLRELDDYPKKKHDFLKAFKLIKALPPSNPNSFWSLASYHGMPFKERKLGPKKLKTQWDGYCQHANVLFPFWHRFYLVRVEQALQTVLPDGDVALHYWDPTSPENLKEGLPPLLLQKQVVIDGKNVPNPLLNFTIPRKINGSPESIYVKPKGYTTVRVPFSGVSNPEQARMKAEKHNTLISSMYADSDALLKEHMIHWLNDGRKIPPTQNSVYEQFKQCLHVSDYNIFSNTTSASFGSYVLPSVEQPHNDIHLALGGFPSTSDSDLFKILEGAMGDMGHNETAAFDPAFFTHHANIDRMFWMWQRKHGKTDSVTIRNEIKVISQNEEPRKKTTLSDFCSSVLCFRSKDDKGRPKTRLTHISTGTTPDVQGPTPYQLPGQELNMETNLFPFQDELGVMRTSEGGVNIEKQLGYTYSKGSLEDEVATPSVHRRLLSWEIDTSLDDVANVLLDEVKSGEAMKAFFDLTNLQYEGNWSNFPLFREDHVVNLSGKRWKRVYHLKVSNVDKNLIPGSFVIQIHVRNGDGNFQLLGQRAVLDRWERTGCANCQRNRFGAVGFQLNNVNPACPWNPENFFVKIISQDPKTGRHKTVDVEIQNKDRKKPLVHFIASFEDIIE